MKNDTVSAPVFLCILAALGVFAVFSTGCGTTVDAGKVLSAITNAIPHTTTTTLPAPVVTPIPPTPPTTSTTNVPVKPLPGADMAIRFDWAASGVDQPAVTATHWCSGKPGDAFEPGKGFEIPISATWSIVGTNIVCQYENGWWYAPGIKASGLVNPIALTFVAKSGTWEYTIVQPWASGKTVLPKKIK